MKESFYNLARNFILNEAQKLKPSVESYIENLAKILETIKPATMREQRYFEIAKHQLREIKNGYKRLSEEKRLLEERVNLLEEEKTKKRK